MILKYEKTPLIIENLMCYNIYHCPAISKQEVPFINLALPMLRKKTEQTGMEL